jgi:tetratricopeptide (TPR) repeat protein
MRCLSTASLVAALSLALAWPADVAASGPAAPSAAPLAPAGPLPELPKLAPPPRPPSDPQAEKDLDDLLDRLVSEQPRTREQARAAIHDLPPTMVGAARARVETIRKSLDRERAPKLLDDVRRAGRKALEKTGKGPKRSKKKAKGDAEQKATDKAEAPSDDDGDWLEFLHAEARPSDPVWKDLVRLTAIVRVLTDVGTTPAVRELISLHAYFGELLRIDLQRSVNKLRDRAVPALIEARQHDAKIVQKWANKQLDVLGRAIPSEAINTSDPEVLADVLRAYGRTREVDAMRVLLSFVGAERVHVREAAREAVAAIGEPGLWQLRDAYLNQGGQKPPKDWTWDRIAREIFALHDRVRLAELHTLVDEAKKLREAGRLIEAADAFDRVLARSPLVDGRAEMAPAFRARAKAIEATKGPEAALVDLRKAQRLDPKSPDAASLEAEIAYLEAVVSQRAGVVDRHALERALELDPSNERAKKALAELDERVIASAPPAKRYLAAGGVGAGALVLMVFLAFFGRSRRPRIPPPAPRQPSPTGAEPIGPAPEDSLELKPSGDAPAAPSDAPSREPNEEARANGDATDDEPRAG